MLYTTADRCTNGAAGVRAPTTWPPLVVLASPFFLALAIIITPADPADETEASAARFIRSVIVVSRFLVRGRRVTGAG